MHAIESCKSSLTLRMSSKLWISGDRPPCTQRNCWFMRAASGKQSKASMHASYTLSEYFILPRSTEKSPRWAPLWRDEMGSRIIRVTVFTTAPGRHPESLSVNFTRDTFYMGRDAEDWATRLICRYERRREIKKKTTRGSREEERWQATWDTHGWLRTILRTSREKDGEHGSYFTSRPLFPPIFSLSAQNNGYSSPWWRGSTAVVHACSMFLQFRGATLVLLSLCIQAQRTTVARQICTSDPSPRITPKCDSRILFRSLRKENDLFPNQTFELQPSCFFPFFSFNFKFGLLL